MEEKKRGLWSSKSSSKHRDSDDSEGSNPISDSSEEEFEQRSRRHQRPRERSYGDFKVYILEFEGQLVPDIFLDWLQTVERVFEYKDIPEGKKVKLVDGDHHERPKDHQAHPKEDPIKLKEVKEVAKLCRKVFFLPEELVPDSSLRKVIFVPLLDKLKWTHNLGAHILLKLKISALK